jgi:hypothetical protein
LTACCHRRIGDAFLSACVLAVEVEAGTAMSKLGAVTALFSTGSKALSASSGMSKQQYNLAVIPSRAL